MTDRLHSNVEAITTDVANAQQAGSHIREWLWKNVATHDVYPLELPSQISAMVKELDGSLPHVLAAAEVVQALSEPYSKFLAGTH